MSKKIYLSPSSQTENRYAVGNTTEAEQCRKIALALKAALERCGFAVKTNTTDGKTMYDRVLESNDWGAELHMPIHTNAFDGEVAGTRMFCFSKTGEGYRVCESVMETLAPVTPGKSDGISVQTGLYEIKASKAPCAYVEVGFHDNKEEARFLIGHTEEIAEAICKGICKHYKVSYTAPKTEKEPEKLYRVQVGAYRQYSNAEAMLKKVKAAGFSDAFIAEYQE